MFCLKCGKQIDDESKFCAYCGAKFSFNMKQHEEDGRSFCRECGVYSDGDFCNQCGKNNRKAVTENKKKYVSINKEDPKDYIKSVAGFLVGFVITLAGALWFVYSFSTIISDISERSYNYIAPLLYKEKMMIFTCVVGFICQYVGIIMVAGNRKKVSQKQKEYTSILSGISYVVVTVVFVWAVSSAIPFFHVCDNCDMIFFGNPHSGVSHGEVVCYKCDGEYRW